jgi:hypothetical protein
VFPISEAKAAGRGAPLLQGAAGKTRAVVFLDASTCDMQRRRLALDHDSGLVRHVHGAFARPNPGELAISAPSCASAANRRQPKRCCARRSREPGRAGARLNVVADLLQDDRAAEALALLQVVRQRCA